MVYINAIRQISAQKPLTDEWFDSPIYYNEPYIRAIDPDFKQYLAPNESRRTGKILKRALITSREACKDTVPEAIITGTGLGCIENTEIFLDSMSRYGEELLPPTQFMQSTHNTVSSLVAIDIKCNSYNITFAHKGISFECALQNAFIISNKKHNVTVLVGAHDEMTPVYFNLLKRTGYLGNTNQVFAGEAAVSMLLSTKKENSSMCRIDNIEKYYSTGRNFHLDSSDYKIDAVMTGINGTEDNDRVYYENCNRWFPGVPMLRYKHLFGESYTAPAFGVYTSAICLAKQLIPEFIKLHSKVNNTKPINSILCYNHFENKNHTFILLSTCYE
ncbi:MAG: beta-ketoacyl synthase chain length factor [Dysgonamonadaceae bacterium]|jgi:hypothetical protein|nr:beta-ketoacyl synthase chain length factor [Dysgonamonadaceae bacterium]